MFNGQFGTNNMHEELNSIDSGKVNEALLANRNMINEGEVVHDDKHRNKPLNDGAYHNLSRKTFGHFASTPHMAEPKQTEESKQTEDVFTFEDMRLKVEDKLQLEPPSPHNNERFTVKVFGYLKGGSILVTAPIAPNGLPVILNENDKVVMRSFSGQNIFAFVCTVQRVVKLPYLYIHLSFPHIIEGVKIRNAPRVKTNIIATVKNSKCDAAGHSAAIMSDICANGVSLMSKQSLGNKGDILHLSFQLHLHEVEAFISVKGVIRTMNSDDNKHDAIKSGFTLGVEFQDLHANDAVILRSMIYQQLVENPHGVL
jgi:hypothetical protein